MHVAIDLGLSHSRLESWKEGQSFDRPSISVRVPGLAVFKTEPAANPWGRPNMEAYLSHLYREYLLPSRMVINTVSVAVPHIMGLQFRRQLLDILEEIMGINEVMIIPRYLALIAGYQESGEMLAGDILIIDVKDIIVDFAFISVCPHEVITLEHQFTGGLADLREEAEQSGYLSPSGWNLDHILVLGDGKAQNELTSWLSGISRQIRTYHENDPGVKVAEGLTIINRDADHHSIRLGMIYPFSFYLDYIDPEGQQSSITKIPFDSTNLEFDWNSRFKLFSFNRAVYGASIEPFRLRLYELNSHIEPDLSKANIPWDMVLEIDSAGEDFPAQVDLILDMKAAIVEPGLPNQTETGNPCIETNFWKRWEADMAKLKIYTQNDSYQQHSETSFSKPTTSSDSYLSQQVVNSLSRVQSLLTLWQKS